MTIGPSLEHKKNDAAGKIVRIMEELCLSGKPLSVRELESRTDIPRSTVHRFLAALEEHDWVCQDGVKGCYRTGYRFSTLSSRPLLHAELMRRARAPMKSLMERTGKTAIMSVIEGSAGLCIHTEEPPQAVKFVAHEGMSVPLSAGATGKVLLAFCDAPLRERILSMPQKLPDGSAADPEKLRRDIGVIRAQGYAYSCEEWIAHAADLSVPVFDSRGSFTAQLGIAGLAGTFGDPVNTLLPILKETASEIGKQL